MWRLLKFIIYLAVLATISFIGYAYIGPLFGADFVPAQETVTVPLDLDLDQ